MSLTIPKLSWANCVIYFTLANLSGKTFRKYSSAVVACRWKSSSSCVLLLIWFCVRFSVNKKTGELRDSLSNFFHPFQVCDPSDQHYSFHLTSSHRKCSGTTATLFAICTFTGLNSFRALQTTLYPVNLKNSRHLNGLGQNGHSQCVCFSSQRWFT